ncbi:YybH family protein [Photobacterium kasasachensis]|uniref:YybH family protein n=1 Tax=Photobacterium kasasachensis TaxID=2910240 RepID=UPI003D1123B8
MAQVNPTFEDIVNANKQYSHIFSLGDAAGVANLYTENGQFLLPNSDFVTGREALQLTLQALMNSGIKSIQLETLEVEDYGDTATEVGKYILEGDGGTMLDNGKYVVIWKKEAGQWKLHRDIINSSVVD